METATGTDVPAPVTLRPGTPVMLRERGYLQVGLAHPTSRRGAGVLLPDSPAVRRLLDDLRRPTGIPRDAAAASGPAGGTVLDRLDDAGLLVDVVRIDQVDHPRTAAARAQFGRGAEHRLTERTRGAVSVGIDPVLEPSLGPRLTDLLAELGLRVVAPTTDARWAATAHLVVASGVLDREVVDALMQASVPHLIVSGDASGMRIGPFVDPGRTACVRCVDAHESLQDPRRPLLLAQAARQHASVRPPRDAALDAMALAWAARDLARFVEGDRPSTWSTTADLGPRDGPSLIEWGRHPDCGCAVDSWLSRG